MSSLDTRQRAKQYAVALCRTYLERFSGHSPDELVRRLDQEVRDRYAYWRDEQLRLATLLGQVEDNIDPPRDITTFLLDHLLSDALHRGGKGARERRNFPIRNLVRDLCERESDNSEFGLSLIALLVVYADHIGDHEGVRRAWDVFSNERSPYRWMLQQFRNPTSDSSESEAPAESRVARNFRIEQAARRLEEAGRSKREIPGILASQFSLTVAGKRGELATSNASSYLGRRRRS